MRGFRNHLARVPRGSLAIAFACLGMIAIMWTLVLERVRFEETKTVENAVQHKTKFAIAYEEHAVSILAGVAQRPELVMSEYRLHGRGLGMRRLASGAVPLGILHHFGILDRHGDIVLASTDFQPLNSAERKYFIDLNRGQSLRKAVMIIWRCIPSFQYLR